MPHIVEHHRRSSNKKFSLSLISPVCGGVCSSHYLCHTHVVGVVSYTKSHSLGPVLPSIRARGPEFFAGKGAGSVVERMVS